MGHGLLALLPPVWCLKTMMREDGAELRGAMLGWSSDGLLERQLNVHCLQR